MMDFSQLSDNQLDQMIAHAQNGQASASQTPTPQASSQPQNAQPQDQYSDLGSFFRGGSQALYGTGPKIAAALATAGALATNPSLFEGQSIGDTYKQAYDISKQQYAESAQQHPIANILGGLATIPGLMAGGVMPGGLDAASLLKVGAGFGLGGSDFNSASDVAKDVTKGALTNLVLGKALGTIGNTIGEGYTGAASNTPALAGALGGIGGGLYGAATGNWNNPMDAITKAGKDALIGAGTGYGIGAGSYMAGRGIAGGSDYLSGLMGMAPEAAALTPEQEAKTAIANKFGANLSLGQASGNPTIQGQEAAMEAGEFGPQNQQIALANKANQAQQYKNIGSQLRNQMGGDEFTESNIGVAPAVAKIQSQAQADKEAIKTAYNINNAVLDPQKFMPFKQQATDALQSQGIYPVNGAAPYNEIEALNQVLSKNPTINFNELEGWRQGLNDSIFGANGRDKAGLLTVKNQFDNYLDNTIQGAVLNGNTSVLDNFQNARQLFADWKSTYTPKDSSEYGKSFIEDIVDNANSREPYTNQMVVNKIFGTNELGFKPQAASIVNELKNQLGEDSPEFQGVKMEAINRVLKPILTDKGDINVGAPAVQTFKNNLAKNMPILKSFLNPDDVEELRNYGDLGSAMFQINKSGFNNSQSGVYQGILQQGKNIPMLNYLLQGAEYLKNKGMADSSYGLSPEDLKSAIQNVNNIKDSGTGIVPQALQYAKDKTGLSSISNVLSAQALAGINNSKNDANQNKEVPFNSINSKTDLSKLPDTQLNQMILNAQRPQPNVVSQSQQDQEDAKGIATAVSKQQGGISFPQNSLVNKIAQVESGGNPNAKSPNSTASGMFQFTNGTWKDAVGKYGDKLGVTLADKNNPQAQAAVTQQMLQDNGQDLTNYLGRSPNDTELYMTHFLGLEGAKTLLAANPNQFAATLFPKQAKANRAVFFTKGRPVTVAELYSNFNKKISA